MDIAPTPELKRFIDHVARSSGSRENFVETTYRQRRHARTADINSSRYFFQSTPRC